MKKFVFCECGSGKPKDDCCAPQIRVQMKHFSGLDERKEFIKKIEISSQFNLRYRGLFAFYIDDLIEYKQERPTSHSRNEFLTILGKYLTEYLEDDCPSSWINCEPTFWEELLFSFYPFRIKITPKEKEVEQFLVELKKFTRKLDKKYGSSFKPLVDKIIEESSEELIKCEHLLNRLFIDQYPRIHHKDWNPQLEIKKHHQKLDKCHETIESVFEVTNLNGPIIVVSTLDTNLSYFIKGLPYEMISVGDLFSGGIGKKKDEWIWTWILTQSVFPPRAKKFFSQVMITI
ncbi:hypothetical protein [Heyndrickxia vini]|uniref:Uncharacterized protein n=1 Tax=Heyndrickxia vini TaxID=1476025 RepID=A0ABX7DWN1_9BACI|nr:hypothetical protein [Heyndrickxia vini]QQZ07731.1 hypothetical protein I5776_11560 [Heyndrickxia vini]